VPVRRSPTSCLPGSAAGDDWHPDRASAFMAMYRAAGGPCSVDEFALLVPFVRWRLREEVRYNLAAAAAGAPWDAEYVEKEVRAFQRLRGQSLVV
jgi:hypothetical protein